MTTTSHPGAAGDAASRETVAGRLLHASARHAIDPDTRIDWDAPLVPGPAFMPAEHVSLYGTDLWAGLDDEQRVELGKHEFASAMSVGLWFEVVLMQLLARYVYDLDPRSAHAQYALTELGDETRHSIMFARTLDKLGVPRYGPHPRVHELSRYLKATMSGPAMFAGILVGEELTDRMQRAMMDDERIQPLIRTVNRIHVIEEARHVRYAREELTRAAPRLGRAALAWHRGLAAGIAYLIVDGLIDPRVYRSVGLSARDGRAAALANPHHRATRRWMGEKVTAFLGEVGMIGGPSTLVWRRAHLL